ncbi:MAG: enoyl-CoA hydratase-related protein [Pseudomonadota bacterium]
MSDSYECFTVETSEKIAHLRFTRPEKANSMIPSFWTELPDAVTSLSDAGEARVLVISAEGKHFSSGMDISVFMQGGVDADPANPHVDAERFVHFLKGLQDAFTALEEARMPVLCAIQGGAIGAGVDLVSAADCRYATADAFFVIQETEVGMTADVGTYPRLVRLIPEGWVRQLSYTAERLPAAKAKEIGLVNEVYPDAETMLNAVLEIAGRIAVHSPLAVTGCKRMINYVPGRTTADALAHVATWNAAMLRPDDLKEAFTAKMEKRTPKFDDLKPVRRRL